MHYGERYEDRGFLGEGAMAEVRLVHDPVLDRELALKLVHPHLIAGGLERFVAEAELTAQLQHPQILVIHTRGTAPDGRAWFTMDRVTGRTLVAFIRDMRSGKPGAWSLRRMLRAFASVCRTVQYAHERGVVHRDLKPSNLMVDRHGMVVVLDWGLAKVRRIPVTGSLQRAWLADSSLELGDGVPPEHAEPRASRAIPSDADGTDAPIATSRSEDDAQRTLLGQVTGTPSYMSPEQAAGRALMADERTDVYALGAVLFHILVGRPPFTGRTEQVLQAVQQGLTALPEGVEPGLAGVVRRAMATAPDDRFPSAEALAEAVDDWVEGRHRHGRALLAIERAQADAARSLALREEAVAIRAEADAGLAALDRFAPVSDRVALWTQQDEADALERQAERAEVDADLGIAAALRLVPGLEAAHGLSAERRLKDHQEREANGEPTSALEVQLQVHADALRAKHPLRSRVRAYLRGEGRLTLHTDPPGASVKLFRFEEHERRLVPVFERMLGPTPLDAVPILPGSYLCEVELDGREAVRVPVRIDREAHWHGIAPGEQAPAPVWLPRRGWLRPGEVYVPGGPFLAGEIDGRPAGTVWVDPFVVMRTPVSNADYLMFLHAVVEEQGMDAALAHCPRVPSPDRGGNLFYRFEGGQFALPDESGTPWLLDGPVFNIDWHDTNAYLTWLARRTGRPWRIASEWEIEKSARGVDGRRFPWGAHFDASWACMIDSHPREPMPDPVHTRATDESVYGVRGSAGNVAVTTRELRHTPMPERLVLSSSPPPLEAVRVTREGSWMSTAKNCSAAHVSLSSATATSSTVGIRGVFSLDVARG